MKAADAVAAGTVFTVVAAAATTAVRVTAAVAITAAVAVTAP